VDVNNEFPGIRRVYLNKGQDLVERKISTVIKST
jgi:hypothetical protein